MNKQKKRAVISLSGGLDSTCLLLKLLADGYEVQAYSFDYGQKHIVELEKVKNNIKLLGEKGISVYHEVIDLKSAFSTSASSLHSGSGIDIPQGHYEGDNMKSTVIENRNIIFGSIVYGKALSWANRVESPVVITLGIHAGDHTVYPDTTKESMEMARELFRISNWGSERVDYIAPFVDLNKGEVLSAGVQAAEDLGFTKDTLYYILLNTHTCYDPDSLGRSCGKCGSCNERLEAFESVGLKDPIPYCDPILYLNKYK